MIKNDSKNQLMFDGFETEFEKWIDQDNKWVKLSHLIPWEALATSYNKTMSQNMGRPGKDARLVIGALIIKHYYRYSDEETIDQIQMNPYYQYFVGFKAFNKAPAFAPSLFVEIRKRMDEDVYKGFEQTLSDEVEKLKTPHQKTKDTSDTEEEQKDITHKGKLIIDATIADQDIRYPTDIHLLNLSREISEEIIDTLYRQGPKNKKPRTYRQKARKDYLARVKQKRPGKKQHRRAIRKQLQYMKRNLAHIETLLDVQTESVLHKTVDSLLKTRIPLSRRMLRQYYVIQHVYQQQNELYRENKCSIANRIVSIHLPEVRPMVRGKVGKTVEFGAKLGVGITEDGLNHLDNLSWDAYNECHDMETHINNYKEQHGHYPEKVLADKIYGTRKNRKMLKDKGIKFGGKPLGRPRKETEENKDELKEQNRQEKADHRDRIPVEGKFGQGKRGYRLDNILCRTAKTSESWIRNIFLVMNILVLAKVFLRPLKNRIVVAHLLKIIAVFLVNISGRKDDGYHYQLKAIV